MAQQMTPEQQEELRKKLEKMSPEELKEFQKQQCIFCHIVSGKVAAKKIYEDDKVLAVLDINPANPGHILLMPKEHHMIMPQLPPEELKHIFIIAKQLSNRVLKALDVRGTNIIVANGPAAGQKAQHFMLHIIPRKEGDGLNFVLPRNERKEHELEEVAEKVMKKLEELGAPKQQSATQVMGSKVVDADFEEEKKPVEEKEMGNDAGSEESDEEGDDADQTNVGDDRSDDDEPGDDDEVDRDEEDSDDLDLDAIARVVG